MITPIKKLDTIANNNIYIKRDDLMDFSFGGNKVRISQEIFDDMLSKGGDCIIGYGSSRSNLCRAIANMSYAKGIPCHIVSPAEEDGTRVKSSNSALVENCNSKIHYCNKTDVAKTVEAVIEECKKEGYTPYYINGDKFGRGNERTPLYAYEKAYEEILLQSKEQNIEFDYIFLATGTGMTQSGLLIGCEKHNGNEKIVGISVARETETEKNVILNFLKCAGFDESIKTKINVTDEYLCGGYGKYNQQISDTIWSVYKKHGIPLDPTYTGKAFYGMTEHLKKNNITNKNILFIHTGGTPLFFDFIKQYKEKVKVIECSNPRKLLTHLKKIDRFLPTPLSARVSLKEFAEKVISKGNVLTIEEKDEIVSAILFYANDTAEKNAYITLLGTLPEYQGKGHGNILMNAMEEKAKLNGMKKVHLDTDIINTKAIAFYSKNGYKIDTVKEKVHMIKEI